MLPFSYEQFVRVSAINNSGLALSFEATYGFAIELGAELQPRRRRPLAQTTAAAAA